MPKFLESALRHTGRTKHGFSGKRLDEYVYGAMQNLGVIRGNKETAKGRRMDAKHRRDVKAGRAKGSY